MSGSPTEAEIQSQWAASVDILESFRNFVDGTLAGAGGKFDALIQLLEGEYTPSELANFVDTIRAGCSGLLTPGLASQMLTPILFEYGNRIATDATGVEGFGSGYRSIGDLFRTLYEWFNDNTLTVESRAITYDPTPDVTGNVGNGAMTRLTVDENGHFLEACHVEKKLFRCRSDQNTGAREEAEVFEVIGEAASFDSVLRASFGSGEAANTTLTSKNAGGGAGGSMLQNSSFSEFTANASPEFVAWTESAAPVGSLDQDIVNFYRSHPGAQTPASLELTGGLGTITLKQKQTNMRVQRLDPDTPYFLRVMLNKTVGTASGGTVTIRMGSVSASVTIAALAAGWAELIIAVGANSWPRTFNEDDFDIEIEWASSTSGTLLVDDVIFAPFDFVDGTYWALRGNNASHVTWLIDDKLIFQDTGGAPATGKVQWWLFVAGFGYLPSSGTPTFADPV